MGELNIAIISPDTIACMGLTSVLQDMHACRVRRYTTFEVFAADNPDRFELILADTSSFLANIDYFIPRRGKTVVITDAATGCGSFCCLNRNADEASIIDTLDNVIRQLKTTGTQQSELSQREIEVLTLVASGLINKEIADRLQISVNTVLTHRKNITAKLGIRSVSGLSVYAMMNGYLSV